jgi:hypothetical protein
MLKQLRFCGQATVIPALIGVPASRSFLAASPTVFDPYAPVLAVLKLIAGQTPYARTIRLTQQPK